MKKILLFIILTIPLIAGNRYVDGRVASSGNGQSWATAWKAFNNIVWSQLNAGDTLFISGGTDSVVYSGTFEIGKSGATNNYLHILGGHATHMSGHNGRVIIQGGGNGVHIGNTGSGISWVWLKGFEIRGASEKGVYLEDVTDHIVLDSLYIYDYNQSGVDGGFGIGMIGAIKNTIIRYCKVVDMVAGEGQSDCVHINLDAGTPSRRPINTIVHNSYFRCRSQDPDAHNDAFQSVGCDGFIMFNNILINDSVSTGKEGGGMPFILSDVDYGYDNPVIIFNNLAFMGGLWYPEANYGSTFRSRHDGTGLAAANNQPSKVFIFNNTFLSNGTRNAVIEQEYLIHFFSNNIVASWCLPDGTYGVNWRSSGNHGWRLNLQGNGGYGGYTGNLHVDSTRNNLNWRQDNTQTGLFAGSFGARGGGTFAPTNWSSWLSNNGTGINADPKLIYKVGRESNQGSVLPDLYSDSPAIDAGDDLGYLYDYFGSLGVPQFVLDALGKDIYGNPRDGSPDIGAYEFQQGIADTIPNFSFTNVTNAEIGTVYIGSARFTDADSTFNVWTTTGSSFKINYNGTSNSAMKTANVNDTVYVSNTSSNNYNTKTTATIVAGGVSRNFEVTTKNEPVTPPQTSGALLKDNNGILIKDKNGKFIKVQ